MANKTGKAGPRIDPVLAAISSAVPMPVITTASRGSKTSYPFDQLTAAGMSFGVLNKTAKQLSSIVSNQNRKPGPVMTNADGTFLQKMEPVLDPAGAKIGEVGAKDKKGRPIPATDEANKPHYIVVDVDAKKDPDKAKARVFRDK